MTEEERKTIVSGIQGCVVLPQNAMTICELKAYVSGYKDAEDAMIDIVNGCYTLMKTD